MKATQRASIDRSLQRDVTCALQRTLPLCAGCVHVSVTRGIVTLRGDVTTLAERTIAGQITARLAHVKGVANDLHVQFIDDPLQASTEIVRNALAVLDCDVLVPKDSVRILAANGWVTLTGTVDWHYQKQLAGRDIRVVPGVRGVTNALVVRACHSTAESRAVTPMPAGESIH